MDYNAPSFSNDPDADYAGKSGSTVGSAIPPKVPTLVQREIVTAEKVAGLTATNDDRTQLAQAIGRGIWLGSLGANANVLVGVIGAGTNGTKPGILQVLNTWTRLRCMALQTNTSPTVTVTIQGVTTASGTVAGLLKKRDGSAPAAGDIPVGYPFELQWDGANFRFVGAVASDAGVSPGGSSGGNVNWVILRDVKAPGVGGGFFGAGQFRDRDLNTITDDPSGQAGASAPWVALNGTTSRFTLLAGKYYIHARCPAETVDAHYAALFNVSDLVNPLLLGSSVNGTAQLLQNGDSVTCWSEIEGALILTGPATFVIRHKCGTDSTAGTSGGNWGFGTPRTYVGGGPQGNEFYTTAYIRKDA